MGEVSGGIIQMNTGIVISFVLATIIYLVNIPFARANKGASLSLGVGMLALVITVVSDAFNLSFNPNEILVFFTVLSVLTFVRVILIKFSRFPDNACILTPVVLLVIGWFCFFTAKMDITKFFQRGEVSVTVTQKTENSSILPLGVGRLDNENSVVWMAIAPEIKVDWEFERQESEKAFRQIPIIIEFSNVTFEDVQIPSWKVKVEGNGKEYFVWDNWPFDVYGLGTQVYRLVWDGRDFDKMLLPPGEYLLSLKLGVQKVSVSFQIVDAGPLE